MPYQSNPHFDFILNGTYFILTKCNFIKYTAILYFKYCSISVQVSPESHPDPYVIVAQGDLWEQESVYLRARVHVAAGDPGIGRVSGIAVASSAVRKPAHTL